MQLGLGLKGEIKPENLIEGWWYAPRQCYICGQYRVVKYTLKTLKYAVGPGRSIQEEKVYSPVCAECGDEIIDSQPKGRAGGRREKSPK